MSIGIPLRFGDCPPLVTLEGAASTGRDVQEGAASTRRGVEESEPSACQPFRAASLIVAQLGPLIVVGENRLIIVALFSHPLAAPLA
jgi:hypothetical protein